MSENWELMSSIYKHLECHKCLCSYCSSGDLSDLWNQMYRNSFEKKGIPKQEESQMLCISFVRLIGEIYIDIVSEYQHVCQHIKNLLETFLSEDLWSIFIHHIKCSDDRHLVWTFIKSFSVILYSSNESAFSNRIKTLLSDIAHNVFEKDNAYILDFFSSLVEYNVKSSYSNIKEYSCENSVSSAVSSTKDLFQNFCLVLSEQWHTFMKQFYEIIASRCENLSLNRFLILWQKLIGRQIGNGLLHIFLNEQYVAAFFSNAYYMPVLSLRIYTDIILQFFISSFIFKMPQELRNSCLEGSVSAALENNFFNSLPQDTQLCGFCIVVRNKNENSSCTQSSSKTDSVIVKKVAFIFLSALTSVKNNKLLSDGVQKVFYFVKENFGIVPDEPAHLWIFDIFIDQDDILVGIMHSLLKIYLILKEENHKENDAFHLQNDLNPHAVFIGFLQRIGFDHSEMLAFLTTDEACFLLYLLQYLKLLLQEWESFIETHRILIKKSESIDFNVAEKYSEEGSENIYGPPIKKILVSYSSSSSSDEDVASSSETCKHSKISCQSNFIVIKTLSKLKEAIQKLVDINEFPYKALPLISLLQACEKHS